MFACYLYPYTPRLIYLVNDFDCDYDNSYYDGDNYPLIPLVYIKKKRQYSVSVL